MTPAAVIDRDAVTALLQRVLGPCDKGLPPSAWGSTVADWLAQRPALRQLPTPRLTLSEPAIQHNITVMATWCDERGLQIAPHGKTTMAPQLWARQLDAGACAITVATGSQLAVALAFGVSRVIVANELLSATWLRWLREQLISRPETRVAVWVDSAKGLEAMSEAFTGSPRPLEVLVERGHPGGRSGVRSHEDALELTRSISRQDGLHLAGVGGYEGALAHDSSSGAMTSVRAYLHDLVRLHTAIADTDLYPDGHRPVVTAGGSAYVDIVAEVLSPLSGTGSAHPAEVVVRSGASLTHDDGFYRELSPWGAHPRLSGPGLRPAIHGWATVLSRPGDDLALLDAGKRDLPYDEGLPEPQLLRALDDHGRPRPLVHAEVSALNDQHLFLRPTDQPKVRPTEQTPGDPVAASFASVSVGDEVRLGISHPCTAFDKWDLIPVIDDPDAPDPVVLDLVRTFF